MIVGVVVGLLICVGTAAVYSQKNFPALCAIIGGGLGEVCLIALWVLQGITGISIGINPITCGVAGILGIPGSLGLLLISALVGK